MNSLKVSRAFQEAREEFKILSAISQSIMPIIAAQVAAYTFTQKKQIDRVESRVKDFESIRDNFVDDYGIPAHQISLQEFLIDANDLIGIRLVVYTDTDVKIVSERLLEVLGDVDFEEKLTIRDINRGARFGYRAAHINYSFDDGAFLECAPVSSIGVEIQIRTLFSDAWARQSHKLLYKGEFDPPDDVVREFTAAAAMLEIIDQKIDFIAHSDLQSNRRPVDVELNRAEFTDQLNKIVSGSISEEEALSFLLEYNSRNGDGSPERDTKTELLSVVQDAWKRFGRIDFHKYGLVDDLLKVRVVLFAYDDTRFEWTVPLHMQERINLIKSHT